MSSYKYVPYFNDYIGDLDRTHIPAFVTVADQKPFRNRKIVLTQNVLAVANFDCTFSYVLTGLEGRELKDLALLAGKLYLGDAGYALSTYVLTPY